MLAYNRQIPGLLLKAESISRYTFNMSKPTRNNLVAI